jgi:catechol 2,3-dioxygenase-like lactoylglutathione lyase family enzyme
VVDVVDEGNVVDEGGDVPPDDPPSHADTTHATTTRALATARTARSLADGRTEVRAHDPAYDAHMLDHLSIQCRDVGASAAFYDAVLAALGGERVLDFGEVIGYGRDMRPTFFIGPLTTGEPNREVHIAFEAPDRAAVRAFFDVAVGRGAEPLHEPREWPEYHPTYYGGFVRDPDGNNVEAVCHRPEE